MSPNPATHGPIGAASAAGDDEPPRAAFFAALRRALDAGTFESLVLSKLRDRGADLKSVRVRRIALHRLPALSFTYSEATRDVTKNFDVDAGIAAAIAFLEPNARPSFAHATLHAAGEHLQLMVNRKGHGALRAHARPGPKAGASLALPASPALPALAASPALPVSPASLTAGSSSGLGPPPPCEAQGLPASPGAAGAGPAHDRPRVRRLSLDLPFLVELGIADVQHRLVPAMARKWRQIDKFLEVLDHALDALPGLERGDAPIRVVDYGSGKGYLTFAVHEHLRRRFGRAPQVTGVELRADLVDFCNAVAARCALAGLRFEQGDLRSAAAGEVDVMIALHACDTATDHAIDLGLRAGAGVLVCSPCCHKELRPQMQRPSALAGVLRHGIHLGQEAEMVTDSLRALLLESCGYEARVFEFVSLEHTSKNKMILATRRGGDDRADRALAEARRVKDFYGIREQCLETLLLRRGALAGGPAPAAGSTD